MPKPGSDGRPRSAPVGRVKAASRTSGSERARLDAAGRPGQHLHQKITLARQDSRRARRRTRGGLTTKIHAIVEALRNPVELSLTPGQASDLDEAELLLEDIDPKAFLADKADDADALIEVLEYRDIVPVIPPKANRVNPRETDFALYRERNLIERFFNKIKHYRAIATRYDNLANTFLAAMQFVAIVILPN